MFRKFFIVAAMAFAVSASAATSQERQYNLAGVTVYDPAELLGFAAQVTAQRRGKVTASTLAETIEVIYREDGYFLAEVFVGSDGQTLVVDEGEIGSLSIEGVNEATFRRIQSYMAPVVGRRAVTQREFERAMMLVEDIQSISATAEIDYPPGEMSAEVRIIASPEDDAFGYVTLDNPSREFGDEIILTFGQQFVSLLTPADMLRIEASGTLEFDGGDDSVWGALAYRLPLGGSGAYAEAYVGSVTARRDRDGTLAPTDLDGNTAILAFGYPVVRDVDTYGYTLLEFRRSTSDVDIDETGEETTKFDSDVDVLAATWIYGKALPEGGAWEYALNVAFGDRTSDPVGFDDGDEDFWHLRFGLGYEHPVTWFGPEGTVRAELWGQYTADRLPSIEEFYIGGREEDRGYVFAEAQGDTGVSATLEVSRDLFPEGGLLRRYRPFGFLDVGWVENNVPGPDELADETLASLGVGVDLEFPAGAFVRSYVAAPLLDGPSTDAGDPAFYLGLTKSW